jgi:SAM-dependent methyltransferase
MNKAKLKYILRNLGLIKLGDDLRYRIMKYKNQIENKAFKKENPNIPIPPDYLLYEAHQLKYRAYLQNGFQNANRIKTLFETHTNLSGKKVLDWGCGPARIVRHFPELLPHTEFFGTDYNQKTIIWNTSNIKGISFYKNDINPPTSFEDDTFDGIYGLSVFTHLSEDSHLNWISELHRISNKDAVVIVTTHGDVFKQKLSASEQKVYESDALVIQGQTLEGHRTFAAYHPPKRMLQLFEGKFIILDHIPGQDINGKLSQDIWILKK